MSSGLVSSSNGDVRWLILKWVGFGAFHSVFAGDAMKRCVTLTVRSVGSLLFGGKKADKDAGVSDEAADEADAAREDPNSIWRWYRLVYNVVSLALSTTLGGVTSLSTPPSGTLVIAHHGCRRLLMDTLGAAAVVGFVSVCFAYDMMYFAGLRAAPRGPLQWSTLHRFTRHPWYTCSLMWMWTRSMDRTKLIATTLATLYFVIGLQFEEARLKRAGEGVGARYAAYCRKVPALIPSPFFFLTREEADACFYGAI